MSIGRVPGSTGIQPTIVDAKGDLIVATAADSVSRLAVGSANQVLTVDSSTSTGLKWATPTDANGFVLIKTASFSGVADTGTTFDDVFSSTYTNYIAYVYLYVTSAAPDIQLQLRYAGPTTQASGYNTQLNLWTGTTQTLTYTTPAIANWKIATGGVGSQSEGTVGYINFLNANDSNYKPNFTSWLTGYGPGTSNLATGWCSAQRAYTGFIMKYSAQNINGTISVYGVSK